MINNIKSQILLLTAFFYFGFVGSLSAQQHSPQNEGKHVSFFKKNIDFQLRAFYSIGGSAPLNLPAEIREIVSYNPGLQLGLEANVTKWFTQNKKWGARIGLAVEGRGMKTKARTKNYLTEVIQNEAKIKGYYTGLVETDVKNTYLTIPVSVVYGLGSRWNLYAGLYAAFLLEQQFVGYVSDGYLREGTPIGQKIVFSGDSKAAYDFSDAVQSFQWGAHVGAEYKLNKHLRLFSTFNYGINSLLEPDFSAISFKLHNIYLDLGFGYQF